MVKMQAYCIWSRIPQREQKVAADRTRSETYGPMCKALTGELLSIAGELPSCSESITGACKLGMTRETNRSWGVGGTLWRKRETSPMMRAQMAGHNCKETSQYRRPLLPNKRPPSSRCCHSAKVSPRYLQAARWVGEPADKLLLSDLLQQVFKAHSDS